MRFSGIAAQLRATNGPSLRGPVLWKARAKSSYHILIQAMLWRGVANAALGARDRFGEERVRVQRYEDFVADPAEAGAAIMAWLGLAWDEGLLAVPMHNSSFSSFDEEAGISRRVAHLVPVCNVKG